MKIDGARSKTRATKPESFKPADFVHVRAALHSIGGRFGIGFQDPIRVSTSTINQSLRPAARTTPHYLRSSSVSITKVLRRCNGGAAVSGGGSNQPGLGEIDPAKMRRLLRVLSRTNLRKLFIGACLRKHSQFVENCQVAGFDPPGDSFGG